MGLCVLFFVWRGGGGRGGGIESLYDMYLSLQYGESPLMWATCKGDAELVKLLLDKGAKVNMQDTRVSDVYL